MDNPSDEAIAEALAEAWNKWRTMIDATECFNKPMEIAFAAGWRAAHARTSDQRNKLVEALEPVATFAPYLAFFICENSKKVAETLEQIRSGSSQIGENVEAFSLRYHEPSKNIDLTLHHSDVMNLCTAFTQIRSGQ